MAFLRRTSAIGRHSLRGSVAAGWGCLGVSSRPDVRVAQQRLKMQLTYSQTPKSTHLVNVSCITCHHDDRTFSHAGRPQVTCAVEGESDCDSSNGSLTLHVIERVRSVVGTRQDESGSKG